MQREHAESRRDDAGRHGDHAGDPRVGCQQERTRSDRRDGDRPRQLDRAEQQRARYPQRHTAFGSVRRAVHERVGDVGDEQDSGGDHRGPGRRHDLREADTVASTGPQRGGEGHRCADAQDRETRRSGDEHGDEHRTPRRPRERGGHDLETGARAVERAGDRGPHRQRQRQPSDA